MNARLKTRYDLKLVAPTAGEDRENALVDNFAPAEHANPCKAVLFMTSYELAHVKDEANSGCTCDTCYEFLSSGGNVHVSGRAADSRLEDALLLDPWYDFCPDWDDYPYPDEREARDLEGVSVNGRPLTEDGFSGDFGDRDDDWGWRDFEEHVSMMDSDTSVPAQASKLIEKRRVKHETPVDKRSKRLRGIDGKLESKNGDLGVDRLEKHEEREQSVGIFSAHIPYTAENIARGKRLHQSTKRTQRPVKRIKRDTIRRARVVLEHCLSADGIAPFASRYELVAVV